MHAQYVEVNAKIIKAWKIKPIKFLKIFTIDVKYQALSICKTSDLAIFYLKEKYEKARHIKFLRGESLLYYQRNGRIS